MVLGRALLPPTVEYVWQVDAALAAAAGRFVAAFNGLFGPELPSPTPDSAEVYWDAGTKAGIMGRCVRLGESDPPVSYYHWGIRRGPGDQLCVHEFWHKEIFTTERYRGDGYRADGSVPPPRMRQ
jgi:hypothetical protein